MMKRSILPDSQSGPNFAKRTAEISDVDRSRTELMSPNSSYETL